MMPAAPLSSTRPIRIRAAVSTRTTVGTPYAAGGRDDVADLLLAAGAVLEVEQHPVEPGGGADLGADRRTRCR